MIAAQELQNIEAALEQLSTQRRTFQNQLSEVESALSLIGSEPTFKIIGNIMVKRSAQETKKELSEKQETLSVRIQTLEKQEEKLRTKQKNLQSEVMKKVQK